MFGVRVVRLQSTLVGFIKKNMFQPLFFQGAGSRSIRAVLQPSVCGCFVCLCAVVLVWGVHDFFMFVLLLVSHVCVR